MPDASWLFSEHAQAIIAGAMGGVVRWVTLKESKKAGLSSVIVGAICGVYLNPIVKPLMAPLIGTIVADEANRTRFDAFVLGLVGITATGFVIDFWRAKTTAIRNGDFRP